VTESLTEFLTVSLLESFDQAAHSKTAARFVQPLKRLLAEVFARSGLFDLSDKDTNIKVIYIALVIK
jgi:hypothetical protein